MGVLKATGLCTVAKCIAKQRAGIVKTIEGRNNIQNKTALSALMGDPTSVTVIINRSTYNK